MEENIFNKTTAIIIIVSLIAGIILGYFMFSKGEINFSKNKENPKEIDILNKEINNCIDALNICESQIEQNINLD